MHPNPRKHGNEPYNVAVIHGGPGAPGTVRELAIGLSGISGILEPLQTSMSIEGQLIELRDMLKDQGKLPMTMVGHSWGAWLAFMFAARYPSCVKKVILVSSGPFEESYAFNIMQTRLERMTDYEREEYLHVTTSIQDPGVKNKDYFFTRFGKLMTYADSYDHGVTMKNIAGFRHDINRSVWNEASCLRRSGKLLSMGKKIRCPVVAIHGDYDPHPFRGVKDTLVAAVEDFRFILLEKCGHYPWLERHASENFYRLMEMELA